MARSAGSRCGIRGGDVSACDECREIRDGLSDDALLCEACRLAAARADGAAEERARIVAMLLREAASLEGAGMGLSSPALMKDFHAMALAHRAMADRIERGEP